MTGKTLVFTLICMSLVGCGSTRTLEGDPADWNTALDSSDRITVFETSGNKVAIRYETISDGVLYGVLSDDAESEYTVSLDRIEKLEIEDTGGSNTGKTLAVVGLVVLGAALIDALQSIPPGFLAE